MVGTEAASLVKSLRKNIHLKEEQDVLTNFYYRGPCKLSSINTMHAHAINTRLSFLSGRDRKRRMPCKETAYEAIYLYVLN